MTAKNNVIALTEKEPAALSSVSVVVVCVVVPDPDVVVRVVLVVVVVMGDGRSFETSQSVHGSPLAAQKIRAKHPRSVAVGQVEAKLLQKRGQMPVLHFEQPPEH